MADALEALPILNTVDDFLAWAETRPERWQFIDGTLVMMAGASDPHVFIAVNATRELANALRGTPCRVHNSDRLVRVNDRNGFYPDVSVSCRQPEGGFSPEPVLVVEVLSPSTERDDRGRKWKRYQTLPGLKHYLLLDQDAAEAELWTREGTGWHYERVSGLDGGIRLEALGIELEMAALYEDVAFPPPAAEEAEPVAAAAP